MNELVHDLTSALKESEIKIDVDEDIVVRCTSSTIHKRIRRLGFSDEDFNKSTNIKPTKFSLSTGKKPKCSKITCKVIDSCSGSDTESAFALPKPTVRKHRRRKARRMETEPELSIICAEKQESERKKQTVKNMDLEISTNYFAAVKSFENKSDVESDISASEESNNEVDGQVMHDSHLARNILQSKIFYH